MTAKHGLAALGLLTFGHVLARHITPPDTVKIDNDRNAECITFEHDNWVLFDIVKVYYNPGYRGKRYYLKKIYSFQRLQVEGNVPVIYDVTRPG